jgi:crotonobetainyl-CoA:carnitine CoA-transferase CaiB-like acyl-CoA transferase
MVKMSDNRLTVRAAPLLGADNDEIYRNVLGLSEQELAALVEKGVV